MAPPLPAPSPRPGAPLPTPSPRPGGAPPMTLNAPPTATPFRTPTSKHRLHFPPATPRSNPHHHHGAAATEHPVEVIGRVRNLTASAAGASALEVPASTTTICVRGDAGDGSSYRDFSLDGVSISDEEDLERFYCRFVRSRIEGVRVVESTFFKPCPPTDLKNGFPLKVKHLNDLIPFEQKMMDLSHQKHKDAACDDSGGVAVVG